MDKSFSHFEMGRDIVRSGLISSYSLERVLLVVVSLTISVASVDVWILSCFKFILCVTKDFCSNLCLCLSSSKGMIAVLELCDTFVFPCDEV